MWKASTARDNQHQDAKAQHEETVLALQQQGEALRTLIERTARD